MKKLPDEVKKLLNEINYGGIEWTLLEAKIEYLKDVDKKLYSAIMEYREGYSKIVERFKTKYEISDILNHVLDIEVK